MNVKMRLQHVPRGKRTGAFILQSSAMLKYNAGQRCIPVTVTITDNEHGAGDDPIMHCSNTTLDDHQLLCRSQTLTNKDDDNTFNLCAVFMLSYFSIGLVFANGQCEYTECNDELCTSSGIKKKAEAELRGNWDAACLVGGKHENGDLNLVT